MTENGIVAINRDDRDGVDVIQLDGEVDLTNADAVLAAVEATLSPSVVLDLTRVGYLDSSGLRAIDRGHRHLTADGRSFFIVSPPDTPADWTFRIAGFGSEWLAASLDAALASAAASRR